MIKKLFASDKQRKTLFRQLSTSELKFFFYKEIRNDRLEGTDPDLEDFSVEQVERTIAKKIARTYFDPLSSFPEKISVLSFFLLYDLLPMMSFRRFVLEGCPK